LTAAQIGASQSITIGAGGTPGAAGVNPGGDGGDTSFGTLCVAKGGKGGVGVSAVIPYVVPGGAGGSPTGAVGDVTAQGNAGGAGMWNSGSTTWALTPGLGGASVFGGVSPGPTISGNAGLQGAAGGPYGAGGNGGTSYNTGGVSAGGPGSAGVCIVTEFCTAATLSPITAGPGITISDTPPATPVNGQLWFESDTGTLWVYYTDVDSSQWVSVGGNSPLGPGGVVQHVYAENTSYVSTNSPATSNQTFVPSSAQGLEILTATITPKNPNNKLLIEVVVPLGVNTSLWSYLALFRDNGVTALTSVFVTITTGWIQPTSLTFEMPAGATVPTTFHVRMGMCGSAGNATYLNGTNLGQMGAGSTRATITVTELAS
jgi:hypothetical protein